MRIDILTLFPDTVHAVLHESILGRAAEKGILEINTIQIRDYTENRQCQVDDYPYGGGYGCVMMAQPLKSCLDAVIAESGDRRRRVIYLSPQGRTFTQETAKRLQRDYDQLVLVCGHYEGVDERFITSCVDEELSLGDFVLTGGEIAAMAVTDAVCRLVPGVLSDPQCYIGESHWDGLLEYPQYTRPEVWEGQPVPEVLLCGDHEKIARWRRCQQFRRTREKRPELYEAFQPVDDRDRELLKELSRADRCIRLTEPVSCRPAVESDLSAILRIRDDARENLRRQGAEPGQAIDTEEAVFRQDIERGECRVLLHGDEIAAVFTLSCRPEPSYDSITDGKWTPDLEACILLRIAVSDRYRGSGISDRLMRFAEQETVACGRRCIRTDTHRKDRPMQQLLRDSGFRYRGNLLCDEHGPRRQAFEKIIKLKKQKGTT